MKLEIISPEKQLFSGEVDMVMVPSELGDFLILPMHAPIISTLIHGTVIYVINEKETKLPISAGFVEVNNDVITICVESVSSVEKKN